MASFQNKDRSVHEHYHINLWPTHPDCGCYAMGAIIAICIAAVLIAPNLVKYF